MNDSNAQTSTTRLAQVLIDLNQAGGFSVVVLTDRDGFPIASLADAHQDIDRQSAVVALVQRTAQQARDQLGMAETDEFMLFDTDGKRLVCRPFTANGQKMILAVLMPDKAKAYRRLTTRAVSAIQHLWKE